MNCPFCNEEKNPFVNKPKHKLYGMCEDCFNRKIEGNRNYKEEIEK